MSRSRLAWDTRWVFDPDEESFGYGDWEVVPPPQPPEGDEEEIDDPEPDASLSGSYKSSAPLATAILICLQTNRALPDGDTRIDLPGGKNRWAGDYFDVDGEAGERQLGSYLWTLSNAPLTRQTEMLAEMYAREALQTIVDQGVVKDFLVEATSDRQRRALIIRVMAISSYGDTLFDNSLLVPAGR